MASGFSAAGGQAGAGAHARVAGRADESQAGRGRAMRSQARVTSGPHVDAVLVLVLGLVLAADAAAEVGMAAAAGRKKAV